MLWNNKTWKTQENLNFVLHDKISKTMWFYAKPCQAQKNKPEYISLGNI
jgi:hypothetical protein